MRMTRLENILVCIIMYNNINMSSKLSMNFQFGIKINEFWKIKILNSIENKGYEYELRGYRSYKVRLRTIVKYEN